MVDVCADYLPFAWRILDQPRKRFRLLSEKFLRYSYLQQLYDLNVQNIIELVSLLQIIP